MRERHKPTMGPRIFPIRLSTQQDFRILQRLPFCYLCGEPQAPHHGDANWLRDRLPPKVIFDKTDRTPPLKLPCHETCRNKSVLDSAAKVLTSIFMGEKSQVESFESGAKPDPPEKGLQATDLSEPLLKREIIRWIRGFHAALYRSFLDSNLVNWTVYLPLRVEHNSDVRARAPDLLGQRRVFLDLIEKNRSVRRLDQIVCYNEYCTYECVWVRPNRGRWFCVWSVDVYGYYLCGAGQAEIPRACVGTYGPFEMTPAIAMQESPFDSLLVDRHLLGAFE